MKGKRVSMARLTTGSVDRQRIKFKAAGGRGTGRVPADRDGITAVTKIAVFLSAGSSCVCVCVCFWGDWGGGGGVRQRGAAVYPCPILVFNNSRERFQLCVCFQLHHCRPDFGAKHCLHIVRHHYAHTHTQTHACAHPGRGREIRFATLLDVCITPRSPRSNYLCSSSVDTSTHRHSGKRNGRSARKRRKGKRATPIASIIQRSQNSYP